MDLKSIFECSIVDNHINPSEYIRYDVKKGLRNKDNTGVLVGLTKICDVVGYHCHNHHKIDCKGQLYYRSYEINELINKLDIKHYKGFEQTIFLLLFSHLPNNQEYQIFKQYLSLNKPLPKELIHGRSIHIMNKLQQAILLLYEYDQDPENISSYNTLIQGLNIISKMPYIITCIYKDSKEIDYIDTKESLVQTILRLIKGVNYSQKEAEILDLMLVLHADHGGGNNSTFTNLVVSSTGTDLYSSICASIGSLKGPRHGGANISVVYMMKAVIKEIGYSENDDEIKEIIYRILNKEFYDKKGLIYGIGHAIYTISDPRSLLLQEKAKELSIEKGKEKVFAFYQRFEKCASDVIFKQKGKRVSSNIDFYSGLVYEMLDIPIELITPLFSLARMPGWLAHNIENKCCCDRIIRPATRYIKEEDNEKSNII